MGAGSRAAPRRWPIMAALWGALLISFFHRLGLGVVADDLQVDLRLSAAALSNLGAAYFYVYGLLQLPVGFILDGAGPKRLSAYGMVLAGAGSFLFALAPNYAVALAGRITVTVGVAGVFLSILKIQSVWFEVRFFSLLAGITSAVGNLGGILSQAPLAWSAAAWGWRAVFVGLAAASVLSAILIWIFVHDRPEDVGLPGLYPYVPADRSALVRALAVIIRNARTWPAFITLSGLLGSSMALAGVWGVTYFIHIHGFSRETAAMITMWMTIGFLIGSPLVGYAAARLGRLQPVVTGGASVASACVVLLWLAPEWPAPIWAAIFLAIGLGSITFILCFTSVKEANDLTFAGLATSVINFGAFTVSALISLLMGLALDRTWDGVMVGNSRFYSLASFRGALGILLLFFFIGWLGSFFLYQAPAKAKA